MLCFIIRTYLVAVMTSYHTNTLFVHFYPSSGRWYFDEVNAEIGKLKPVAMNYRLRYAHFVKPELSIFRQNLNLPIADFPAQKVQSCDSDGGVRRCLWDHKQSIGMDHCPRGATAASRRRAALPTRLFRHYHFSLSHVTDGRLPWLSFHALATHPIVAKWL